MVDLADGQEQPGRQPRELERRECERRLAESAEMLAKGALVERALRCRREIQLGANRDRFAIGDEDGLELTAGGTEHTNVEARLALAELGGKRGVAGARALEQRGLGGAQDAPALADGEPRRCDERLPNRESRRERAEFAH